MISNPIPILKIGKILLAPIQTELKDTVVDTFQQKVLQAIQQTNSKGLIIDISGVEMVDTYTARVLLRISKMARLMGTETILVGIRAEIAATLVRMGYLLPEIKTALDLEEGLQLLGVLIKAA